MAEVSFLCGVDLLGFASRSLFYGTYMDITFIFNSYQMKKLSTYLLLLLCLGVSSCFLGATTPEVNLYGHLVSSQKADAKLGIYQFTSGSTEGFSMISEQVVEPNAGSVKVGNLYYVFNISNEGEYGKEYHMYIYDISNNYTLVTKSKTSGDFMTEEQVIAYDPTTEKIFCAYSDAYSGNGLATINVSNRSREKVASLGFTKFLTLSFDSRGKLYGITNVGMLYEINTTNGELRYIGSTGISPAEWQQATTFVPNNDSTLYWAECSSSNGALYAVNVINAKATLIKLFPHEEEFATLWAGSVVVQDAAPGAATDLKAEFINGSLSGFLQFKAPLHTHNGNSLTGTLSYMVKIDDIVVAHGSVKAGDVAKCPLTTTQGMHDFTVVLSNDAGDGDEAFLTKQYIGNDTPGMVRNVRLVRGASSNELVLSWDAPQEGIHGGYFDPSRVKYKIRRMPSDVIVSNVATSPMKDVIDVDKPIRCFYDIIPYMDESTQGVAMSSNKVMVGTPFAVPYTEDFSSNDNVTSFAIEDSNADGITWEHMYEEGYMRIWSSEKEKDEWLFIPFISLEKNTEYRLSFDVRSISTEKMEVRIGGDALSSEMGKVLVEEFEVADNYEWTTKTCTFSVDETKPWFIGFHSTTTDFVNALAIYLDNIKIEKILGVQSVDKENLFSVIGNELFFTGSSPMEVCLFGMDGSLVLQRTLQPQQKIRIQPGIYVIRVGDSLRKILIK